MQNFSKFLDNVAQVQEKLSQNLKDQLDTAPLYLSTQVKSESEDNDSDRIRPKKMTIAKKKRSGSSKLRKEKQKSTKSRRSPKYPAVKMEVEPFFDDFDIAADLRGKRMPTNPKRKKNAGDAEEDAVERVFEKELKFGKFDHPIETLNCLDHEVNEDGSLNKEAIKNLGDFRWSAYVWKCSECDENLDNLTDLRRHYRHEHDIRPFYRCSECPKKFRIISAMFTHYFEHNPNAKFCCMFCDRYYCDVLKLYYHQKKQHKSISKLCLYCGKQFYLCSYLREHRDIHPNSEDPKPIFTCV